MNRLALTAAIALALSASPVFSWDDKECADWDKTHPTPHPDCVQSTPTPRPHHEKTPTPGPTNTPQPTATPEKDKTPTPVATPNRPQIPTSTPSTECIPCGEATEPTPVVVVPATSTPVVLAAVAEAALVTGTPPARPVQVLSAAPVLLPAAGTPIPYVASLLLGLGLTIGGWLLRRKS